MFLRSSSEHSSFSASVDNFCKIQVKTGIVCHSLPVVLLFMCNILRMF